MDVGDYASDCSSDPMCAFVTGDMMGGYQKRVFVNTRAVPRKIHVRPEFGQNRYQRFDSRSSYPQKRVFQQSVHVPSNTADMFYDYMR